jgi:hypothetical protein
VFATVTIMMTKLVNSGLNVLETGRWFHKICMENGADMKFICDVCL